ncbi:hypothetical protein BCR33DRAFT_717276 [Rhizoclosmatium globosum]|uniref:Uncharacterized protein n=1 Tax=Rhizoclosmatium globosum TaxID=329046 RepID=A0A1Y2CBE4_9FUNG|nr:hypothetical protein BCR33DRAFT_717276 [Rhizoclosmatium globosum]|eukprot:ORY44217.1 hypothetical protein BCR33DRAFT_717276 [Rhizoclosmatium globosum]
MFSYGGRGGTSMRLAGYGGHDDEDEDDEENELEEVEPSREATMVQSALPTKPVQISPLIKAAEPKISAEEQPLPKAQSNSIAPNKETTLKSALKNTVLLPLETIPVPLPNQPVSSQTTQTKITPLPLASSISEDIDQDAIKLLDLDSNVQSPPTPLREYYTSDFHGDQKGALRLSERHTMESKDTLDFYPQPKSRASVVASKDVTASKESFVDSHIVDHNAQNHPAVGDIVAPSVSDAPVDGIVNEEQILTFIRAREGRKILNSTSVEVLMRAIATNNDWSDDEMRCDVALLHKYRLKSVKNLRALSGHAWSELTDILPTTKDLIRKSIAWEET